MRPGTHNYNRNFSGKKENPKNNKKKTSRVSPAELCLENKVELYITEPPCTTPPQKKIENRAFPDRVKVELCILKKSPGGSVYILCFSNVDIKY